MDTRYLRNAYSSRFRLLKRIRKEFPYEFIALPFCYASTMASYLWPINSKERLDRARFCQLLVDFGMPEMKKISIPLLYHNSTEVAKKAILSKFPLVAPTGQIITSKQIDCDENSLKQISSLISLKDIRKYSYVSIYYEELRCPLIHTGWTSKEIMTHPMHDDPEETSYVNELIVPPRKQIEEYAGIHNLDFAAARRSMVSTVHRLYLSHGKVVETIKLTIDKVLDYWDTAERWGKDRPAKWWIHGDC